MKNIFEITDEIYKEWLNKQGVLFYVAIKKARKDFLSLITYFITYIQDYVSYRYYFITFNRFKIRRLYDK